MKSVLIYSGGLDSTVLLYHLLKKKYEVRCLSVSYGQRHNKEILHARTVCERVGVEHRIADMEHLVWLFAGSSQTSPDMIPVPEGHYTDESMKLTVVPNRNMVMLSLAVAWAISTKSQNVYYAAHAGDHAIYPDCRETFIRALRGAISECDWNPPTLVAPFALNTKAMIVKLGFDLSVPFEQTWSCYKGGEKHCGKCGTCVERREAFILAQVIDPTEYES